MSAFFERALDYIARMLTWLSVVGATITVFYEKMVNKMVQLSADAIAYIASFSFPGISLDFGSTGLVLSRLNVFIPLKETWFLTVAILTFWSAILLIRWIKSFIPTVSN